MRLTLVLLLLLAVFIGISALYTGDSASAFALTDTVTVEGFGLRLTSIFIVMIASTLVVGLLLGQLFAAPGRVSAGRRVRAAEKRLAEVEAARSEAAAARAQASGSYTPSTPSPAYASPPAGSGDAAETQRLADEVARRTAAQNDPPPPRP